MDEIYRVLKNTHVTTGKHGHARNRIEAVNIFTKKKRWINFKADDLIELIHIEKRSGQVLTFDPGNKFQPNH